MKYIITENKLDKVALTWLNNNFGNLTPIVKEYKTYYVNEDRLPLFYHYQDSKNDTVYINYHEIWSFLESMFGMDYQQIQGVIIKWLEETYNLKGITPNQLSPLLGYWLEETYNLKGITPGSVKSSSNFMLEETYNLKEMKYIITENKLDKVALTWLNNNFGDLTPVVKVDKTYYVNEDRLPLFYYVQDSKNDNVFINYHEIWSFLESMFGMEYQQIQGVIRDWLEETYNLKGITPKSILIPIHQRLEPIPSNSIFFEVLEETYNLKEMKYIITENKLDRVALTWLNNNFGDLKPIVKEYKTYYVNDDESPLFFYFQDRKNNNVYINYDKIWSVLETMFGMKSLQIKVVIIKWLEETYNLRDLTPTNWWKEIIVELDETYNIKKK